MKAIANKNNKTLGIYMGEEYDIYFFKDKSLVSTINENGDEIVISSSHFDYD